MSRTSRVMERCLPQERRRMRSRFFARRRGLVFSAGTVQWAWGLDPNHDSETGIPPERANAGDIRIGYDQKGAVRAIQQATLNLFADMGVQPTTLQKGLVRGSASTDKIAPTSKANMVEMAGRAAIVSGTASDQGGGVVAGVEVSIDGGKTWHPAQGTDHWSYQWDAQGATGANVMSRAVDDSGNLEKPAPAR